MKRKLIPKTIAGLIAATVMLAVLPARATLTFNLNEANIAPTGPYGTVTVTWGGLASPNTASVMLTAANGYSFGDGVALGLNLANTGVTLSSFTATQITVAQGANPNFAPQMQKIDVNDQNPVNGWDKFNYQITLKDGYGRSVTAMSFVLTLNSGSWANENAILTLNDKGYSVVGHVMNIADQGQTTGYTVVPEPTTMIAGALLLLPFGMSTVRFIRKNRTA